MLTHFHAGILPPASQRALPTPVLEAVQAFPGVRRKAVALPQQRISLPLFDSFRMAGIRSAASAPEAAEGELLFLVTRSSRTRAGSLRPCWVLRLLFLYCLMMA